MLKIKDTVDLKELEKFGFKRGIYYYEINICKNKKTEFDGFGVDKDSRIIINYASSNNVLDILYNLIQAGLVEKVEREDK